MLTCTVIEKTSHNSLFHSQINQNTCSCSIFLFLDVEQRRTQCLKIPLTCKTFNLLDCFNPLYSNYVNYKFINHLNAYTHAYKMHINVQLSQIRKVKLKFQTMSYYHVFASLHRIPYFCCNAADWQMLECLICMFKYLKYNK